MSMIYDIWREIHERSEGLALGAIAGYLAYLVLPVIGLEFTIVATEMSIVESLSGEFFVNRSLTILIGLGMIGGYFLDKYKSKLPQSLGRWF